MMLQSLKEMGIQSITQCNQLKDIQQENLQLLDPLKLNVMGQKRTAMTGLLAPGSIKAGLSKSNKVDAQVSDCCELEGI